MCSTMLTYDDELKECVLLRLTNLISFNYNDYYNITKNY